MDIKSLMIGDWVYDTLSQTNIKVNRGCFEINPLNGICYAETLIPIPLTKEILKMNGMVLFDSNEYKEQYIWFKNGKRSQKYISVTFYDDKSILVQMEDESVSTNGVNKVHNCDIHYVHELQHALRLCGISKEFEL